MPKYSIKHITRYKYPSPVVDSANQIMLFPISDQLQDVKQHDLSITHQPSVEVFTDYFGNQVGIFSIITPHQELNIESSIEVIIQETILPTPTIETSAEWNALAEAKEQFPYMDFMGIETCESEAEINTIAHSFKKEDSTPFNTATALSAYIYNHFEYKKGITSIETGVDEIWKIKAGVCQDFAHILLIMLRQIGIPARYVSGYICPKNHELRGEGATHAWVEAYIPYYGWIGLDPTNNCVASDRHVRLAVGRNFSDCTPVKGMYKGSSEHSLEVSVIIENGAPNKENSTAPPVFSYQIYKPEKTNNSYRRFMEIQQQQ